VKIMVYPKYRGKEATIPAMDHVVEFFNRNPPGKWTPLDFARDPETLSLDDFTDGLQIIKEMGRKAYNAYAGECHQWMKENQDDVLATEAKSTLEAKLTKWNRYRRDMQTRDAMESRELSLLESARSPDLCKNTDNVGSEGMNGLVISMRIIANGLIPSIFSFVPAH
jgi:hypothetical protein